MVPRTQAGYSSWHTNEQADAPRLLLETIDLDHGIQRREFRSWPEVVPEMRAWADRMVANDALSLRAFKLTIRSSSLQLTIPTETGKSFPKDWAVLGVGPLTTQTGSMARTWPSRSSGGISRRASRLSWTATQSSRSVQLLRTSVTPCRAGCWKACQVFELEPATTEEEAEVSHGARDAPVASVPMAVAGRVRTAS